jgi:cell division protein FtsL
MAEEITGSEGRGRYGALVRSLLFFIVSVAVFILVMIFKLGVQNKILDIGYEISQENKAKRTLLQERKQLDLEIEYLKSPGRIEEMARLQYEMKVPAADQIIHLRVPGRKR